MTTRVCKNKIYRKLNEDIHVVIIRGRLHKWLIKINSSPFVIAQLLETVYSSLTRHRSRIKEPPRKTVIL